MNRAEIADAFAMLMTTKDAYEAKLRSACDETEAVLSVEKTLPIVNERCLDTKLKRVCACCGQECETLVYPVIVPEANAFGEPPFEGDSFRYISCLAARFDRFGIPTELAFVCHTCSGRAEFEPQQYTFRLTVHVPDAPVHTVSWKPWNGAEMIGDLQFALAFLEGAGSYLALAERCGAAVSPTAADQAILRVLGIRPNPKILLRLRMNRQKIDAALDRLRQTRNPNDTHVIRPDLSTCYVVSFYYKTYAEMTCSVCGKTERFSTDSDFTVDKGERYLRRNGIRMDPAQLPPSDIIRNYQSIAQLFADRGYEASVICRCSECNGQERPDTPAASAATLAFSFRASGMRRPAISTLDRERFDSHWLRLALDFLDGAQNFPGLAPRYNGEDSFAQRTLFNKLRQILGVGIRKGSWPIEVQSESPGAAQHRSDPEDVS